MLEENVSFMPSKINLKCDFHSLLILSFPKALEAFKPLRSFVRPSLVTIMSSMNGADLFRRRPG